MTEDVNTSGETVVAPENVQGRPISIPGYDLKEFLGEGGMARVYRATHKGLGVDVALKMMSDELAQDPEFQQRFAMEAQIVAKFRHDNIVRVVDFGIVDNFPYIAMELLEGGTLADKIASEQVDEGEVIRIAASLASALALAASNNIVHRDFKPANIMLTNTGTPVLTDFGVAKSISGNSSQTQIGTVIGAPRYMSPEQALGRSVSPAADIYAMGLVIFEMLLRDLPPKEYKVIRGQEDARQLTASLKGFDPALVNVITECLAADPLLRPSAAVLEHRLRAISAPPRPFHKYKNRWIGLMILFGLATAGASFRFFYLPDNSIPVIDPTQKTQSTSSFIELDLSKLPKNALLFVNSQSAPLTQTLRISPMDRMLLIVAAGFKSLSVNLREPLSDEPVQLEPLSEPSFAEWSAWSQIRELVARGPSWEVVEQNFDHESLRLAARLAWYQHDASQDIYETFASSVTELANRGDHAALVASYLWDLEDKPDIDALKRAGSDGYGLASLLYAFGNRENLTNMEQSALYGQAIDNELPRSIVALYAR